MLIERSCFPVTGVDQKRSHAYVFRDAYRASYRIDEKTLSHLSVLLAPIHG